MSETLDGVPDTLPINPERFRRYMLEYIQLVVEEKDGRLKHVCYCDPLDLETLVEAVDDALHESFRDRDPSGDW